MSGQIVGVILRIRYLSLPIPAVELMVLCILIVIVLVTHTIENKVVYVLSCKLRYAYCYSCLITYIYIMAGSLQLISPGCIKGLQVRALIKLMHGQLKRICISESQEVWGLCPELPNYLRFSDKF